VIVAADRRFFAGTGLANGDVIGAEGLWGGACGWEVDTAIDFGEGNGPPPPNLQILAHGQNVARATETAEAPGVEPGLRALKGYTGHMTYYETGAGGFVFSIGSITFGGSLVIDPVLQTILRNALDACVR